VIFFTVRRGLRRIKISRQDVLAFSKLFLHYEETYNGTFNVLGKTNSPMSADFASLYFASWLYTKTKPFSWIFVSESLLYFSKEM